MEYRSGAMEWSLGVDFGVEFSQILSFCCPSWTGLTSSLSMLTFTVHSALDSLCFFCRVSLTCFNQALNIWTRVGISNPHPA